MRHVDLASALRAALAVLDPALHPAVCTQLRAALEAYRPAVGDHVRLTYAGSVASHGVVVNLTSDGTRMQVRLSGDRGLHTFRAYRDGWHGDPGTLTFGYEPDYYREIRP